MSGRLLSLVQDASADGFSLLQVTMWEFVILDGGHESLLSGQIVLKASAQKSCEFKFYSDNTDYNTNTNILGTWW